MIRAYAELLRLPNVFTAFADVLLGWLLVSHADFGHPSGVTLLLLLAASGCLYSAGMALNDFFDVEQDRRERPFRPIPSGRISRNGAGFLGFSLLAAGVGFAAACFPRAGPYPAVVAIALAASVLLYDAWLKRTGLGPGGMALCRMLNVLLGIVAVGAWPALEFLVVPFVVGVYVAALTGLAQAEAKPNHLSSQPLAAWAVILVAAVLLGPWIVQTGTVATESKFAPVLAGVWAMLLAIPLWRAVSEPTPVRVQAAVRVGILGLIPLDALLAFAGTGWIGLSLLALLVPALILGRWVYST